MECPRCEEHGTRVPYCLILFGNSNEVKLETGKDKELFYRKTRLAWATWRMREHESGRSEAFSFSRGGSMRHYYGMTHTTIIRLVVWSNYDLTNSEHELHIITVNISRSSTRAVHGMINEVLGWAINWAINNLRSPFPKILFAMFFCYDLLFRMGW